MKPDIDPVALFALIAGAVIGQKLNPVLAAYLLIIVMATGGGLWALGRQGPDRKYTGLTFLFIVNCIAVGTTSVVASFLASKVEFVEAPHLFAPVALVIGAIGLDWPIVIPKIIKLYKEWRTGGKNAG